MSLVKGIHHMSVKCGSDEEYSAAVSFYHSVLGMKVIRSWGSGSEAGMMLDCGGGLVELCASGKVSSGAGAVNHVALATDDVDACAAAVSAAGYPITLEPVDVVIQAQTPYSVRVAFCLGPAGEELEFFREY